MKKQLLALALSLVSVTAFAANIHTLQAPKRAHVSKTSLNYTKKVQAQMTCKLFTLDTTNGNEVAQLVATEYGPVINVGEAYEMIAKYPAPYNDVKVRFTHANSSFFETGYDNFIPFISSEFWDEHGNFQYQDANFSIEKARSGSNIMLRGAAVADDNVNLYYQCAITFLK